MYLLFVASPMQLNKNLEKNAQLAVDEKTTELTNACKNKEYKCEEFFKGLAAQLEKANTEIQSRLNQETEWFKLKYYVVGVLLLGFLVNAYFKHDSDESDTITFQFQHALTSPITSFILSLTVMVAVSIDMQIRAGRIVINQLGTWIAHYVEPLLLGTGKHGGLGWEQFLRLGGGYHANTTYAMTFWTNIYYLSIVLYTLYLTATRSALDIKSTHAPIVWYGFWLLHVTLYVGALSNHVVPFTFEVTWFPLLTGWWQNSYVHPAWLILVYSIFWIFLTLVAYKCVSRKIKK